ncbi:marine proteobacterial sortase target protein [Pseudomonadota bacterium]
MHQENSNDISRSNTGVIKDVLLFVVAGFSTGIATVLIIGLSIFLIAPNANADELPSIKMDEVQRGSLLLKSVTGAALLDAPMVKTDVNMHISGMLARVSVKQQFHNPGSDWVEGVYVFPLPEDSAVDRLRMRIGERVIESEIQEKAQARKTYEKAKRAGRKASLLKQERPNIFTSAVANIGPGEKITIEIEYQQTLRYDQGSFHIRFPLVVAPRYIPGIPLGEDNVTAFNGSGWAQNTNQVPDASHITPPVVAPESGTVNPISIQVSLEAGFPLARLESPYHAIERMKDEKGVHQIKLKAGEVSTDRDFELVWTPKTGHAPHAALFTESWEQEEYALLMVMPPVQEMQAAKMPREVIFVVDTSGSMHGASIRQAREALKMALQRLTPADYFNAIQFNSHTHALFNEALAATPQNIKRAMAYVDGLAAEGGTEMLFAIKRALNGQAQENRVRQVIFLTDGSVGNETALFQAIKDRLGSSRLFTVGIGSAPNSHFMTRAAQFGRGTFSYIGKVDEVKEKMTTLFSKLESPVLTDIHITWPENVEVEMWPQRIPDLYLGEPVIITSRMAQISGKVVVEGRVNGHSWRRELQLKGGGKNPGVNLLWARRKIADLMDQQLQGRSKKVVRDDVLKVALRHKLVSRYTSLVAVDKTPARPLDVALKEKAVPVNLAKGMSAKKVFGSMPQTATPASLHLIVGFIGLLLAFLLRRRLA